MLKQEEIYERRLQMFLNKPLKLTPAAEHLALDYIDYLKMRRARDMEEINRINNLLKKVGIKKLEKWFTN